MEEQVAASVKWAKLLILLQQQWTTTTTKTTNETLINEVPANTTADGQRAKRGEHMRQSKEQIKQQVREKGRKRWRQATVQQSKGFGHIWRANKNNKKIQCNFKISFFFSYHIRNNFNWSNAVEKIDKIANTPKSSFNCHILAMAATPATEKTHHIFC